MPSISFTGFVSARNRVSITIAIRRAVWVIWNEYSWRGTVTQREIWTLMAKPSSRSSFPRDDDTSSSSPGISPDPPIDPHPHWEYHQGVYGTSGKPNKITRSYHTNSSSRNYILLTVLIIIDWFLTKMYGEVDIKLGKDWRDLRIVKELSAQVIDSDGHTRGGRSYKSLQQCSTFPASYLISLCVSMSGQVLDISIIGLTIGGLVHMVPLSLSSDTTIPLLCVWGWARLRWALTGSFMWQPIPLWWPFAGYGLPQSSPAQFVAFI